MTWVEGRCLSYGTAIPYLLALDLLRSKCGILETDSPDVVTEKVRSSLREVGMDPIEDGSVLLHLLEIKDAAGSPALSNPEAVKSRAFETLRRLAVKGSHRQPLVLVLEDLHWVDKISEEFLGFLAENVRDVCVLLLATYRPGYRPPWMDKSYAGQTPLQPLSRVHSIEMVSRTGCAYQLQFRAARVSAACLAGRVSCDAHGAVRRMAWMTWSPSYDGSMKASRVQLTPGRPRSPS